VNPLEAGYERVPMTPFSAKIRSLAISAILLTAASCSTLASVASDASAGGGGPSNLGSGASGSTREPVAAVVQQVLPAVVNVTTDVFEGDPLNGVQQGQGVGTGFIVRSDGIIVTNCHVIEQATRISVFTSDDQPKKYDARVIGGDCQHDLAVLKVDATGLPTVPLGDSSSLLLGQRVVAIGYALALEGGPSVTSGIVSSMDRVIKVQDPSCDPSVCGQDQTRTYSDVIQTDAAINHGNSGGPLVDMTGHVVGINSAGSDSAENIGFAIAIDAAKDTIQQAVDDPLGAQPYLGVQTVDLTPEAAFQLGLSTDSGAYVVATSPDGPAEKAGIKEGDVITGIDGTEVTGAEQVGQALTDHQPGDTVTIDVTHADGGTDSIDVTLGTRPLPAQLP
jgi:serine protease Do